MKPTKKVSQSTKINRNPIDARQKIAEQQGSENFLDNLERLRLERQQREKDALDRGAK